MKWSTKECATELILSASDASASNAKTSWSAVIGDEYLNSGIYDVELFCDNLDNLSCFFGVAAPGYWKEVEAAAEDEEAGDALPRDSKHVICMHGDGRCFIKGKEKDWGLMRVASGEPVFITLDFDLGIVSFKLSRTVRGKVKETIAEIPGLFPAATIVACFGGRDQQLTIAKCARRRKLDDAGEGSSSAPRRKVRDVFAEAIGDKHIAPVPFTAPSKTQSYEAQIRDMAATMETSM